MSKMGREAFDRDNKCKSGVKDICKGETERENEWGVRQCEPCAAHIADFKSRMFLWQPEPPRGLRHKPGVMDNIDHEKMAEALRKMDVAWDDLIKDEDRTPYNCNETRAEERRKLIDRVLVVIREDIERDGDITCLDELLSFVSDEYLVGYLSEEEHSDWDYLMSRGEHQPCLKESKYWLGSYEPPFKSHEERVAECDCPKCVTEEHDPYENMGCGEWCVCERCVAEHEPVGEE
tara:strand:- start:1758 stop:2459 length:702 start_codon:yes stop_codon:yes gene_type:complete